MSTLYLTTAERALYAALPASVKSAWGGSVEEERGTAWETEEELQERYSALTENLTPEIRVLAERVQRKITEGKDLDQWSADDMPEESLPTIFFMMGAIGLSPMIERVLPSVRDANDVETVALLSTARHRILETNATFAYVQS